jgi:hypothetical protein
MVVDLDVLPRTVWSPANRFASKKSEYDDGSAPGVWLGGQDQAAESGLHAKHGEIVAGDARNDAMVAAVIGGEAGQGNFVGDDLAEGSGLIAKVT